MKSFTTLFITEEPLVELKHSTLKSYVRKAVDSKSDADYSMGSIDRENRGRGVNNNKSHEVTSDNPKKQQQTYRQLVDTANKRKRGITNAMNSLSKEHLELEEGRSRIDSVTAHEILTKHDAHQNFFTLRTHQVHGLLDSAKEHGYRKSKNAPGSTGRMFHQHLSRLAAHAKVTEESELQELSVKTKKSYLRKVEAKGGTYASGPKSVQKALKRNKRVNAIKKTLSKEEVELVLEASLTDEQFHNLIEASRMYSLSASDKHVNLAQDAEHNRDWEGAKKHWKNAALASIKHDAHRKREGQPAPRGDKLKVRGYTMRKESDMHYLSHYLGASLIDGKSEKEAHKIAKRSDNAWKRKLRKSKKENELMNSAGRKREPTKESVEEAVELATQRKEALTKLLSKAGSRLPATNKKKVR